MEGTPVAQITTMGSPGSTRDLVDASAYGDEWKDYVLGQQDGAEVQMTMAFDPEDSSQTAFKTAYDDATPQDFIISQTESGFWATFPALVTSFATGGERDGLLELTATLKIVQPGVTFGS
jgi:hypothetical protein